VDFTIMSFETPSSRRSASAPVVAVVGASTNPRKFGNRAVRAFVRHGYDVRPIHPTASTVEGLRAYPSVVDVAEPIDLVTMYVPPEIGVELLDEIARKGTKQLWINPGAESTALIEKARRFGFDPILACSILRIGDSPDRY
jgi:predicted CoA-binding protein